MADLPYDQKDKALAPPDKSSNPAGLPDPESEGAYSRWRKHNVFDATDDVGGAAWEMGETYRRRECRK